MSDPACRCTDSSAESGREGTVDVELLLAGQRVSSCRIVPLRLRIGAAVVRMDGIGRVETEREHRHRGFARSVMDGALRHMEADAAALTMLYGIAGFYPKFGYVTVGPESTISLPPADGDGGIPSGYSIRPFGPDNLPRVQRLYDEMTAGSVATALRRHDSYPWTTLMEPAHTGTSPDCQVVTDAGGQITAYVWRGELLQFVRAHSQVRPDELIVAEVVAADVRSARAALALCRQWAAEEGSRRPIGRVTFFAPHEGPVAAAAMRMHATLARRYEPDGGWMARVLSASRLLSALEPELSRCLAAADTCFRGTVRVMTDAGEAALAIDADGVRSVLADAAATDGEALVCRLPQTVLARLALGCFPPEDLLVCLPHPPEGRVMELLQMLFPPRAAQLFLADRF